MYMTSMNRDDLVRMRDQLDREINMAETELDRKRSARNAAVALLAYMDDEKVVPVVVTDSSMDSADVKWEEPQAQPSEIVMNVFTARVDQVLTFDDVEREAHDPTGLLDRERIRNAVHYLVRKHKLDSAGRGKFVLKSTSAPGVAGAEGSESAGDSTSSDVPDESLGTGGGSDESVPLPSRDEDLL